jgi:hypothetical protein
MNVINAFPSKIFNGAAKKSLAKWRFKPVQSTCHSIQLDFSMGK